MSEPKEDDAMLIDEYTERWKRAAHAMQSGVAFDQAQRPDRDYKKDLRVGVNVALRDAGSLVELLIAKGLVTRVEYMKAIAEGMEQEAAEYEARASQSLGRPVKLG